MSPPFILIALVAAVLIVNWRLTLLVVVACFVAFIALGLGFVPSPPTAHQGSTAVGQANPAAAVVGQPEASR